MTNADQTLQFWIEAHPYLKSIAQFDRALNDTASATVAPPVAVPDFTQFEQGFEEGIPLLRSSLCRIDFGHPAVSLLAKLAQTAADEDVSENVSDAARQLLEWLEQNPEQPPVVVDKIIAGETVEDVSGNPGLLRLLTWRAAREVLRDVAASFERWRSDKTWGREYCPTCGARPVLAQLLPSGNVRERMFSCGLCATQWSYKRIGCPYCMNEKSASLAIIELEGEENLRLDVCGECKGYTKTNTGADNEALFLADWTTLHLDVVASQNGFKRMGASLYEL